MTKALRANPGHSSWMKARCWLAIATSNFCGPQFRGMWRDVAWHQRLTAQIKAAPLHVPLGVRTYA